MRMAKGESNALMTVEYVAKETEGRR